MIFISSSCIKSTKISKSVEILAQNGIKNIELSGGTAPYSNILSDLLYLKEKYNLNYLCHNYFPPPKKPFVLNLASLDKEVFDLSFEHVKRSIELSSDLGADKFGFHAGFLINIPLKQIGDSISEQKLFNRKKAIEKFNSAIKKLKIHANSKGVSLYIENNVISQENYMNFNNTNPFLFTDFRTLQELSIEGIKPLLDYGHLKVSANVLNLDFKTELNSIKRYTNYFHLSENNGLSDQNKPILDSSSIFTLFSPEDFKDKTITLEVYGCIEDILISYKNIKAFIK